MEQPPVKYGSDGLMSGVSFLVSLGIAVELRKHGAGRALSEHRSAYTELIVDPVGNDTEISRSSAGRDFDDPSLIGRAWITPAMMLEDHVTLTQPMRDCMHIYLADSFFSLNSLGVDNHGIRLSDLPYTTLDPDPLITEIARSLRSELLEPSSVRKMIVQTLGSAVVARLAQRYMGSEPISPSSERSPGGLDRQRLRRVVDYIDAQLGGDLSIAELASVACLSQFHFARSFKAATGDAPHQYVRRRRLERAKALLLTSDMPLEQIAFFLGFANQANFSRAFQRNTGTPPGAFRRGLVATPGPIEVVPDPDRIIH